MHRNASFVVIAACCAASMAVAAPPQYTILDLGTLGGAGSHASGLGPQGWVVGHAADGSGDVEGYVHALGLMQPLGRHGAPRSWATGVNQRGAIALNTLSSTVPSSISGSSWTPADAAFLFDLGSKTPLGSLGGGGSFAWGINDSDMIVGESRTAQGVLRPFLWSRGRMSPLPLLSPWSRASGVAYDVNASGQAVGWGDVDIGDCCEFVGAMLWERGTGQWLPSLALGLFARAQALNDAGTVVGAAQDPRYRWRAVRWKNFAIQDLGTLGGASGFAYDINSREEIVGVAADMNGMGRPFWYSDTEGMHDLNGLVVNLSGWSELREARSINDAGQITGVGRRSSGALHAFLLTPAVKIIEWPVPGLLIEREYSKRNPALWKCPVYFCDMFPP